MKADEKLDLCGVIELCCFLQCKSTLAAMEHGQVLEICLCDSETAKDLMTILERSGEIILGRKDENDHHRLWVRKGPALDCRAGAKCRREKKDV